MLACYLVRESSIDGAMSTTSLREVTVAEVDETNVPICIRHKFLLSEHDLVRLLK